MWSWERAIIFWKAFDCIALAATAAALACGLLGKSISAF
jgi:hypothetical protein